MPRAWQMPPTNDLRTRRPHLLDSARTVCVEECLTQSGARVLRCLALRLEAAQNGANRGLGRVEFGVPDRHQELADGQAGCRRDVLLQFGEPKKVAVATGEQVLVAVDRLHVQSTLM